MNTNSSFSQVIDLQVELLKVLANKTRLAIIYKLKESDRKPFSELREELAISKANLSQHLSILKKAEIISVETVGRNSFITLQSKGLVDACSIVREMIKERLINQIKPFLNDH